MMIPTYLNDLELPQVFSLSSQEVVNYIQESNKDEHIVDSESKESVVLCLLLSGSVRMQLRSIFR